MTIWGWIGSGAILLVSIWVLNAVALARQSDDQQARIKDPRRFRGREFDRDDY